MNHFSDVADPVDILLVDDRPENLLALEAVLSSPEYRLIKVDSGDEALRYLLDHNPALILMDVQMPKLDGFATAAIIKGSTRTREIPIIFLTAIGRDERYVQKGYTHGAVDYLSKPFDALMLRSKVAVFADLHRKNESLVRAERRLRESERRDRERKIAELELRSLKREQVEQKRYRDLVEGIDHGIVWSLSPRTGAFTYVSGAAEKILGHSPVAWIDGPNFLKEILPEVDEKTFREAIAAVAAEESDRILDHRLLSRNGASLWFHTCLKYGTDTEGNEPEIRGLSVDITQIKEAQDLLRLSKARSDLLAEVSLVLAESFDYGSSLPKLTDLLSRRFADWVQIEIFEGLKSEILAVSHADPMETKRARAEQTQWREPETFSEPQSGFYPALSRMNLESMALSTAHLEFLRGLELSSAMVVPLQARGNKLGYVTICRSRGKFNETDHELGRDIAFRVGSAVDNWRLYQGAENAIQVRDEFLSIASHELKTPLTPLKIQTQQLLRLLQKDSFHSIQPEKVEKMLFSANRQIDRLSKLIDDLLDISRISMGKLQLHLEDFDLMQVAADLHQRFSGQLQSSGCELKIVGPEQLMVHWDLFRAEQVIVNLLTNAMKYGPEKPIELKISESEGSVTISVRDHGIGVAPEDQERIFKRFERAVSGTHFGGLGLGLYIVSQILSAHGGRIFIESTLGEGSIFYAVIPADVGTLSPQPKIELNSAMVSAQ